jgi:hypothetical protein
MTAHDRFDCSGAFCDAVSPAAFSLVRLQRMCLRTSNRNTTAAGVPRRPRLRLLGRRFANASYTAATISPSAST